MMAIPLFDFEAQGHSFQSCLAVSVAELKRSLPMRYTAKPKWHIRRMRRTTMHIFEPMHYGSSNTTFGGICFNAVSKSLPLITALVAVALGACLSRDFLVPSVSNEKERVGCRGSYYPPPSRGKSPRDV
jgi:hypothetical protein